MSPKKARETVQQYEAKTHDLSKVKLSPYNPRVIPPDEFERLKKSLLEYGLVEPLVLNLRTMHVVGGNQRMTALVELGETSAPFMEIDVDESTEKALNLALNKISGDWDMPKLTSLISELAGEGLDMDLTGFSELEVEALAGIDDDIDLDALDDVPPPVIPGDDAEDDEEEPEEGAKTRPYVIYITFKDKDRAERFLLKHGITHSFAGRNRESVFTEDELMWEEL